jgi:hypothetical protein
MKTKNLTAEEAVNMVACGMFKWASWGTKDYWFGLDRENGDHVETDKYIYPDSKEQGYPFAELITRGGGRHNWEVADDLSWG